MRLLGSLLDGSPGRLSQQRADSSRLGLKVSELAILAGAGALATTLVAILPMPIRVPGHAILKAALPVACGIALVPRPLAGTMSALAAGFTALIYLLLGIGHLQSAAITSLLTFGPAVDLSLRGSQGLEMRSFARVAFAGLAANLLAFGVRWAAALFQANTLHPLNFNQMAMAAFFSFAICGLAAGLVGGLVCFRRFSMRESKP